MAWLARRYGADSVLDYSRGWPLVAPPCADLVVCTNVLEDVEALSVGSVLKHIDKLTRKAIFVVVSLSNGLTVRPEAWWRYKMDEEGWVLVDCPDMPLPPGIGRDTHCIVVAEPCR